MSLTVFDAADVRRLLPMSGCIAAMDRAMRAVSAGKVSFPPRLFAPLIDSSGHLGVMPGSTLEPPVYGAKLVGLHPGNPAQGRPTIQGFVALFDHATGTPLAIVEGSELTALRTAAASGLATRELARADAHTHGVFGTGVQARSHVEAVACVREITEVRIWGRDAGKCGALVSELAERWRGVRIRAARDATDAAACDIVSTTTASAEPVLRGSWLASGAHLNVIGSHLPGEREVDADAVARAAVYVDSRESALREAGDLLLAMEEGAFAASDIVGEIGEVLLRQAPGRESATQITLYKSLGNVAQDLFAAAAVYQRHATRL